MPVYNGPVILVTREVVLLSAGQMELGRVDPCVLVRFTSKHIKIATFKSLNGTMILSPIYLKA